jgi:hypothetical protein
MFIREQDRNMKILQESLWHLPNQRGFARFRRFIFFYSPAWILIVLLRHSARSDYKLKRETIHLFQLANEAGGMQRQRRSVRSLRVAFALFGDEFPKTYSQLIIDTLKQTQRGPTRRSELSDEVLDATKALAMDTTDSTGWYQLSRGLFSIGFFRAAWFARENSVELSILKGEGEGVSANAVWRAIQANLERRNFLEAEALLSTSSIKDSLIHETRNYLYLMQKKFLMPGIDSNSPYFNTEVLFNDLITGKTVALVGTGSPSGRFGDEIDSADTVVRVKYIGRKHIPLPEFHGLRCDISTYPRIDSLVSLLDTGHVIEFLDDLKLMLGNVTAAMGSLLSKPVHQLSDVVSVFGTTSTSGIRAMFQILLSEPKSLKIYGYDFYSRREQYDASVFNLSVVDAIILGDNQSEAFYTRGGGMSEREISKSFSAHDPVSNFCFAQNLYKAGLFDIEPYGKSILELTPYQYVERLEEMLGDW